MTGNKTTVSAYVARKTPVVSYGKFNVNQYFDTKGQPVWQTANSAKGKTSSTEKTAKAKVNKKKSTGTNKLAAKYGEFYKQQVLADAAAKGEAYDEFLKRYNKASGFWAKAGVVISYMLDPRLEQTKTINDENQIAGINCF